MNIEQAKALCITTILEKLGYAPTLRNGAQCWYLSPLREENTASFHVHTGKNIWYDFGEGRGGNVIALAAAYLQSRGQSASLSDALRLLAEVSGPTCNSYLAGSDLPNSKSKSSEGIAKDKDEGGRWILKEEKPVSHLALVRYLKSRSIPLSIAREHLREVKAQNSRTGKIVFCLGFKNEDGGWELRNPFFQSSIAPKTITFIRGYTAKPEGIHLFEGWPDFLSVLAREQGKPLENDAIVLNSLGCISHALPYLQGYGYSKLFTWMDNDKAGKKATDALAEFAASEPGLAHLAMNKIYDGYKDVNEWHMANPLPLSPKPQKVQP